MERKVIDTDILIIGGGTAGCMAAVEAKERYPQLSVTILEKAHIDRSGCLAGGMNAINAYLNKGETPESFTRYVRADSCGLIREDLVQSMSELFEYCVKKVEKWGLPILCDDQGNYLPRGRWNIKINGESLKPILAKAARSAGAQVFNWVVVTNLLTDGERVAGAVGFSLRNGIFYVVKAKATIIATGGAAGLYRPNNPGDASHKTWYCPYNTGAGYAMGIRAGAEMTSFEMRYVALRTKDTIAPTGTIALGVKAPQVNAKGEQFMKTRYAHLGGDGAPTPYRTYGPLMEIKEGRGPVYLDTRGLTAEQVRELKSAYLDMYPSMVLYWAANNIDPSKEPIEVQTTEPYIVGGHCQAGYWVDGDRRTTVKGLYAAGDVAGGAPYKFVSGCWAEGVLAARAAGTDIAGLPPIALSEEQIAAEEARAFEPIKRQGKVRYPIAPTDMEARLQKLLEQYAGGASTYYEMNEEMLQIARQRLSKFPEDFDKLVANDLHQLMKVHEIIDRVDVAQTLVEHLLHRRETRWPSYQTRTDYPERDDVNWLKFVNTRRDPKTGKIEVLTRPYEQLIPGDRYKP
ncbi:MAG: adenylyl-sulfate reductase subunit alpha [Nitrospirae bacterium]|nr:adenylyl-sulfate reductase subunit alpha [Candidatus Manganitrophaceae bacterium]